MEGIGETTIMFPGKNFHLKVVEDIDYLLGLVKTDDDVPFWAVLWPAAIGMSEYFWEHMDFTGQRVLELGAGLGLVGIVAAAKGAALVQTDFISEAMQLAEENSKLNGIDNIKHILADWRNFHLTEKFDWIIGSDILYEPKLHPYLKEIFRRNLKPNGRIALSDPGREDARRFIEELSREGYSISVVAKEVFETGRRVPVSLYLAGKKE